ncbi:hypothetical protein Bca101_052806 [Brassica carinata]
MWSPMALWLLLVVPPRFVTPLRCFLSLPPSKSDGFCVWSGVFVFDLFCFADFEMESNTRLIALLPRLQVVWRFSELLIVMWSPVFRGSTGREVVVFQPGSCIVLCGFGSARFVQRLSSLAGGLVLCSLYRSVRVVIGGVYSLVAVARH